tara:strand:- start:348 stop:644 length:297 start_codon:yes stop_codon:yes gene_type:complete
MSRAYPIWNEIQACIYKNGNKSYGVKKDGVVNVKVGTSKTYSYDFITHTTTRRELNNDISEFRFYVDGKLLKRSQFNKKTKVYSDNLPINNHQKLMGE